MTRISKTQGGVKTKYINDLALPLVQVLMETDNTGVVQATYNYGADLISMNRAGVNSFYHYDGLGSTRQLTNNIGSITDSYTYDAFGNLIASSGSVANAYGFTGEQQFNEADNLVFLRARYYKPSIGRFISRDPVMYKAGLNLYAYVENNPINFVDPSGTMSVGNPYACAICAGCFGAAGLACGFLCAEEPYWDCPGEGFVSCMDKCLKSIPGATPLFFVPCSAACIICKPRIP